MRELLDILDAWRAEGMDAGRAIVVRAFGSTPRPEGAVLIVADDGRLAGSVSGGCVDGAVAEEILAARRNGRERVIRYGISDEQAWDVGLACGGTIDVLVSPAIPADVEAAARGRQLGVAVVTSLPDDSPPAAPGPHLAGAGAPPTAPLVVSDGSILRGSLGDASLDDALLAAARAHLSTGASGIVELGGRQLFVEVYAPRPRLVAVGAGEVARSLVVLAAEVGYETVVIDGRAAFLTRERFPGADRLLAGWPDEVAGQIGLGPADAVAVLTHDPKFDEPAIVAALARDCRYVGVIGSRRTQAERRTRLLAAGVAAGDLDRLRGPIGLYLGGRSPSETALAILAEVVAERRAGSGRPMRDLARERGAGEAS